MKKVLELIDGGFLGGGQTHILSIAKNIDKKLFDVSICASPDGEFKKLALNQNYKFIDLHLPKLYRRATMSELLSIVERNDFDIIHSHGGVAGVYARMLKRKLGRIKVVHTFHGIHYINSKNIFRKNFSRFIEQRLVRFTDKSICVSETDFNLALKNKITDKNNTVIIKNGIDIKKFSEKFINPELIAKLGIQDNHIIIGNISRFDYQKNQRFLIHSLKEILKNNKNVKLLLVGSGAYLNECKSLAKNLNISGQTIFTGEVSDVENYYPLIDIFVFPSLWEGLSITLLEAMASRRCIVASDIISNREIIKNHFNGILYNLNDEISFLNSILRLLNDRSKMDELAKNAGEEAVLYDEKEMAKKIENVYSQLV